MGLPLSSLGKTGKAPAETVVGEAIVTRKDLQKKNEL